MNSKQEKALNELIDQAQELKMGYEIMDWISVKDRLPKKYARVLVTDGNEVCIHYKQSGINFEDECGYDLYCGGKYDDCNIYEGKVTHWMPLPKPPENI